MLLIHNCMLFSSVCLLVMSRRKVRLLFAPLFSRTLKCEFGDTLLGTTSCVNKNADKQSIFFFFFFFAACGGEGELIDRRGICLLSYEDFDLLLASTLFSIDNDLTYHITPSEAERSRRTKLRIPTNQRPPTPRTVRACELSYYRFLSCVHQVDQANKKLPLHTDRRRY